MPHVPGRPCSVAWIAASSFPRLIMGQVRLSTAAVYAGKDPDPAQLANVGDRYNSTGTLPSRSSVRISNIARRDAVSSASRPLPDTVIRQSASAEL